MYGLIEFKQLLVCENSINGTHETSYRLGLGLLVSKLEADQETIQSLFSDCLYIGFVVAQQDVHCSGTKCMNQHACK